MYYTFLRETITTPDAKKLPDKKYHLKNILKLVIC